MKITNLIFINSTLSQAVCEPWLVDFSQGLSDKFTYEGPYDLVDGNLRLKLTKGDTPNNETGIIMGYGALVKSKQPIQYGTLSVLMSTARMAGVVTAFTTMSDDKDEIDWEWVGKNETEVQTNYYSKGKLDYTKGQFDGVGYNTHTEQHNYAITWTPSSLSWSIDGTIIRSLNKEDTLIDGVYNYPMSASYIFLSLWDGGSGAQGTRDWAGGQVDWNDAEYVANGGFIDAKIKSISYQC